MAIESVENAFVVRGPRTVTARRVVVATGLVDTLPAIPGVEALWGTGAVVCPYCDGWEVRDGTVGVIATSPMSRNQAHLLRQWTADLTVFGAREAGIAATELEGFAARGIRVAAPALQITGAPGNVVVHTDQGEHRVARVFVGARPVPSDHLLVPLGCAFTDGPAGSIVRTDGSGETTVRGVWAIGNVADAKALVPIAIGAGTRAAVEINISLLEDEIRESVRTPRV